jgi:hypothetical protein
MTRSLLVVSSALLACTTILSVSGPAAAPARTLAPVEVWSIFGGGEFQDRCCRTVSGLCGNTDKGCDDPSYSGTPCSNRVHFDSHPVNKKFCHTPPALGVLCTESEYDVCETWKRCNWVGENCVSDQVFQTQSSPVTCTGTCP